jgi:hypothetical protein
MALRQASAERSESAVVAMPMLPRGWRKREADRWLVYTHNGRPERPTLNEGTPHPTLAG